MLEEGVLLWADPRFSPFKDISLSAYLTKPTLFCYPKPDWIPQLPLRRDFTLEMPLTAFVQEKLGALLNHQRHLLSRFLLMTGRPTDR